MKVVIEKATGKGIYFFDSGSPVIDQTGLHFGEVHALDVRPETHDIIESEKRPEMLIGGVFALVNGSWEVANQSLYRKAAQEQKQEQFDAKVEAVKTEADERIEAGAPHNGTRWPADVESQLAKASVAASVGAGKGLPKNGTKITARDINRVKHTMTQTDYLDMSTAVRDYVFSVKETADDHIDALMALLGDGTKTAADIQAHDTSTGWPV